MRRVGIHAYIIPSEDAHQVGHRSRSSQLSSPEIDIWSDVVPFANVYKGDRVTKFRISKF